MLCWPRLQLMINTVLSPENLFSTRQHAERAIMLYAIANPSVCLSVTRVDQSKTVEVRIMQFSPYSSAIPLVFALQVSSRNSDGISPSGGVKQWWVAAMRETSYFHSSNAFARWLLKLRHSIAATSNVFARWRTVAR